MAHSNYVAAGDNWVKVPRCPDAPKFCQSGEPGWRDMDYPDEPDVVCLPCQGSSAANEARDIEAAESGETWLVEAHFDRCDRG